MNILGGPGKRPNKALHLQATEGELDQHRQSRAQHEEPPGFSQPQAFLEIKPAGHCHQDQISQDAIEEPVSPAQHLILREEEEKTEGEQTAPGQSLQERSQSLPINQSHEGRDREGQGLPGKEHGKIHGLDEQLIEPGKLESAQIGTLKDNQPGPPEIPQDTTGERKPHRSRG